jgi:methylglyoxal synthase
VAGPSIDDLLEAVKSVQDLKNALLAHDELFAAIVDRLSRVEQRLTALEVVATGQRTQRE